MLSTQSRLLVISLFVALLHSSFVTPINAQESPEKEDRLRQLIHERLAEAEAKETEQREIEALRLLDPTDPQIFSELVEALASEYEGVGRLAVKQLSEAGESGKDVIFKALTDKRAEVRCNAVYAYAFELVQVSGVFDELRMLLNDENPKTFEYATQALRKVDEYALSAIPEIINATRRDKEFRKPAIQTIISVGLPALPLVLRAFSDEDENVRAAMASVLSVFAPDAPDEIYAPLFAALDDECPEVVRKATYGLSRLGEMSTPVIPKLLELLKTEDAERCMDIPKALMRLPHQDPVVLDALIPIISHPDKEFSVNAIREVATLGPEASKAVPALLSALKNKEKSSSAAYALSKIDPSNPAPFVTLVDKLKFIGFRLFIGDEATLFRLNPPPRIAAESIAKKLISLEIAPDSDIKNVNDAISVLQSILCDNLASGDTKQFLLLTLGKIGTPAAISAISEFERWAENERDKRGWYPEIIHPGSNHIASYKNRKNTFVSCQSSDGTEYAFHPDYRYGYQDNVAPFCVVKDGDISSPLWVGLKAEIVENFDKEKHYTVVDGPGPALSLTFDSEVISFITDDSDNDGLPDFVERCLNTNPSIQDTDGDGVEDEKDGNPLTSRHKNPTDVQAIRQALFSFFWGTGNSKSTLAIIEPDQEFYGHSGIVVPYDETGTSYKRVSFGVVNFMSETQAELRISDYQNPLSGSTNTGILQKIKGKWVVVKIERVTVF